MSRADPEAAVGRAREELARQDGDLATLVAGSPVARLVERPPTGRWSVAEHLQHMARVNGPHVRAMKAALRERENMGVRPGRKRNPLLARLLIRFMEPPPRPRVRTLRAMAPQAEGLDLPTALRDFDRAQTAFRILLDDLGSIDQRRVLFTSPFAGFLNLTVDQGIRLLLAHNRRHLWLAHEAAASHGARAAH